MSFSTPAIPNPPCAGTSSNAMCACSNWKIATIPIILSKEMNIPQNVAQFFGGTSVLIAVGVLLDTMRQIESHLMMRHYDGFLKKGRVRGRL